MRPSRAAFVSLLITALALLACLPGRAGADTIGITGLESGGYSTATFVVEFNSQTSTLTFTGTNTSAITQPGSTSTITSIGFDLPPLGSASASGLNGFTGAQASSLSSSFSFSDAAVGAVPGFGAVLDFAFLTDATFGGGLVADGLLPGESASFAVSGAAFTGFSEAEIANSLFVRFLNVPKAAGSGGTDVAGTTAVPEPATGSLFALALAGVFRSARKRMAVRQ